MSKSFRGLSSTEVIQDGTYLDEGFDPKTLTVAQLGGVLSHHGIIVLDRNRQKGNLLDIWKTGITDLGEKLRHERWRNKQIVASREGILDGLTGEPIENSTVCVGVK